MARHPKATRPKGRPRSCKVGTYGPAGFEVQGTWPNPRYRGTTITRKVWAKSPATLAEARAVAAAVCGRKRR